MRRFPSPWRIAVLAAVLVFAVTTACLAAGLYQAGTIAALAAGDYAGLARYADLARHGDCGLGTFTNLDGEMVALDGRFYQIKSDGTVHRVAPGQQAPFAQVAFFTGTLDLGRVDGLDLAQLTKTLSARLPDPSRFYLARVDGLFARLTTRSVPAQARPWPPLAEVVKRQSVFPLENIQGTLVGIYTPPGLAALSPPGWHFHFLSADRTRGGHVLAARLVVGKARADRMETLAVTFPKDPAPRRDVAPPAAGTE